MFRVLLLRDEGIPVGAGLPLELVGDRKVLARAAVDEDGLAIFDCDPPLVKRLGVRIDRAAIQRIEKEARAKAVRMR
jgi:hypothetical protein